MLAAALVTAGCTNQSATLVCPDVGVINGLHSDVVYQGSSDDANNAVYAAEITSVASDCDYDDGIMEVALEIAIAVRPGPQAAGLGEPASIDYFVAVENNLGGLIGSDQFQAAARLDDQGSTVVLIERLTQQIAEADPFAASRHRILVGFNADPATGTSRWRAAQP